jgi:protocatechuate 3,4-dioxygenase beta subunit
MKKDSDAPLSRRTVIIASAAAATGITIGARETFAQAQLTPTPACGAESGPTIRQTEGPFFTPNSPQRQSLLEAGVTGRMLELSGFVLTRGCKPVAGALADFWQADASGAYDNNGFRLRGHQFTDAQGRYRLRTIMPALYSGRTPHIHVKVQAPNRPVLTTQLYFPDQPANGRDPLFRPELMMRIAASGDTLVGRFDFVLDLV